MKVLFRFFLLFGGISPGLVMGHGGEKHDKLEPPKAPIVKVGVLEEIKQDYVRRVKPIFEAKCFNCHSSRTDYPWYYELPVVGRIMDSHIKEARTHMDMTKDYPFKGHGGPIKDLEEIIKVTGNDEMPPWYYTPFHQNSKLSDLEKQTIMSWSKESLAKLKEGNAGK